MKQQRLYIILFMIYFCLILPEVTSARVNNLSGSLTVREGYDSNIFRTNNNKISGWTTTISPSLEMNSEGINDALFFNYEPRFSFDHETNNNEVDHLLLFNGDKHFTKTFHASLHETYIRSSNTFIESENLQLEGRRLIREVNRKDRLWTNSISIRMDYEYARESTFSLGYANDILEHITNSSGNDNYIRHNPNTSLSYQFNNMWGIEASYSFIKGDFDFSDDIKTHRPGIRLNYRQTPQSILFTSYNYTDTNYSVYREDYKIHDLFIGMDHEINTQTIFSLSAGASRVDRSVSKDRDGYNLGFGLTREIQRGSLHIEGNRGFEQSVFSGSDDGLSQFWLARVSLNYQMSEKSIADVFIGVRNDDYFERTTNPKETEYYGSGGLSYTFTRWFILSFRYNYIQLNADDPDREYVDHRFYVALGAAKDLWRW